MKYLLYIPVVLGLLCCQPRESNEQEEGDNPATPAADTAMATPPAPDSAYLIVPGESIGRIKLGMPAAELHGVMGQPDSGDAAMGKSLQFWISIGSQQRQYVAVYTVNNFDGTGTPPEVQQVQVTSRQFQTSSGLGTGSALAEVREQYAQLEPLAYYINEEDQQVYIYDAQAQGIAFEVTMPDSTCTAVTIYPKGTDVTGTYLPVHPDLTRLRQP